MEPLLHTLLLAPLLLLAQAQPAEWLPRIAVGDLLWAPSDAKIKADNMPMIGNGFAATQITSSSIWVSGLFNGYLTSDPSHRARVPTFLAAIGVPVPTNATHSDAALDIRQATYLRRSYLDPDASCAADASVSCTTSSSRVTLEQRFYAHRTLPSVLVMEVEVLLSEGAAPAVTYLGLTTSGPGPSDDVNFTVFKQASTAYRVNTGWTQVAETNSSSLAMVGILASNLTSASTLHGLWPVQPGVTLAFFTVIRTSLETQPESQVVPALLHDYAVAISLAANGTLHSSHVDAWAATVWGSGYEVEGRLDMARAVNTSLYSILSSVRGDRPYGLAPGGLTNGYNGHSFWDVETWMQPSITLTHPDISNSLFEYRFQRLNGSMQKAQSYSPPYSGTMFPWESAFTGEETCPSWADTGLYEIHISGDIAFAAWQFYQYARDDVWLAQVGWPLLEGIATFWVSKVGVDNPNATFSPHHRIGGDADSPLHICGVIPPDEYHEGVCDSVYTNVVAILSLQYAKAAATILGKSPDVYAQWQNVSSRIVVLFNETVPGFPGGLHPEYAGYFNDTIKQADVILLGFPLGFTGGSMTPATRENDLRWYARVTDVGGPAMTWSMMHIGFVELREWDLAASNLNRSFANAQPPFDVWTETPDGGTPNFLTGAGGFLQAAYFGHTGLRINDTALRMSNPTLPEGSRSVKLRGMAYLGNRLDVSYDTEQLTLLVRAGDTPLPQGPAHQYAVDHLFIPPAAASLPALSELDQHSRVIMDSLGHRGDNSPRWTVAAIPLVLVDSAGMRHPLTAGEPLVLPLQDITIQSA